MDEERIPRRIQYGEIGGRRPIRRRWEDAVKEDSNKILKMTGWRSLVSYQIDNTGEANFRRPRPAFALIPEHGAFPN